MWDHVHALYCLDLSLDNPIPDHTTIMNFRHLFRKTQTLRASFLKSSESILLIAGIYLKEGTIVDATIIEAGQLNEN